MKKLIFAAAIAALALSACNRVQTEPVVKGDPTRPVRFSVTNLYNLQTKADAIANGKFVAVYAGSPVSADNVKMTVSMDAEATSGTLVPTVDNSLLWAVGQTTEATNFLAVYPYEAVRPLVGENEADKYIEYSIASADDVDYANHFLAAAASQAPGSDSEKNKVALAFAHPFAKLVYNITNNSDDFVASASISGIRRNGHLMFTTGEVVPVGDAIAADAAVTLNANGDNSWMTVVMPEDTPVNPQVKLTMTSGATYTFALSEAIALEAGKVYTATITVTGSHSAEVSERTVTGTFTVADWTDVNAGSMQQGSSTAAPSWWYITGNIDDVNGTEDGNWSKNIPLKCISATQWQVDFYYAGSDDPATNGFKLIQVGDDTTWFGMSPSNNWVIDAADVKAEGEEGAYRVHSLTSADGNVNIAINATGKYRIVFTPSASEFYIYTLE